MQSFGGTFGISVPLPIDIGCCFSPTAVASFFRKERKAVSYTVAKGKLVVKDATEKITVPCLPVDEMVTLDVLSSPTKTKFDTAYLKIASDVVDPASSSFALQGIAFHDGMLEATDRRVLVSALSDLPDDLSFILPVASAKALLKFKSPVVGVALDQRAVKFVFKDGASLTSLIINDQFINTEPLFGRDYKSIELKADVADLLKLECENVEFKEGDLHYDGVGVVFDVSANVEAKFSKKYLDVLLSISSDIRVDSQKFFMAVSDKCRSIACPRL